MIKKQNGITLVVLVITIVIMLILAGVVLNLSLEDNGVIESAKDAAGRQQNAQNNEIAILNHISDEYDEILNYVDGGSFGSSSSGSGDNGDSGDSGSGSGNGSGGSDNGDSGNSGSGSETPGNPDETTGIFTENSTINGESSSYSNPEIPKGFKPIDEDDAIWGADTGYQNGLIIEDEEGNQFVWVAVDGTTVALNRYTFTDDGTATARGSEVINYYYSYCIEEDSTDTDNLLNLGNTIAKDINAFKSSVSTHGGYYIARYEASYGLDGKPNSKISTGTPSSSDGEAYAPTEEGQLWNNITQPNAANACRNMYNSNYGITSDLINSYAWDTAIVFIQTYSDKSDYSNEEGSKYNTTLTNTGVNVDEICHIHNMASNCREMTTETNNDDKNIYVSRGGIASANASLNCTCFRGGSPVTNVSSIVSFRPILYL